MKMNPNLIPIQLTPTHLICVSVKARRSPSIYTVDLENKTCNCPSHWFRGGICKHLRAAAGTTPLPANRLGEFLP